MKGSLTSFVDAMLGFVGTSVVLLSLVSFNDGAPFDTPPAGEWQTTIFEFNNDQKGEELIKNIEHPGFSLMEIKGEAPGTFRQILFWKPPEVVEPLKPIEVRFAKKCWYSTNTQTERESLIQGEQKIGELKFTFKIQ